MLRPLREWLRWERPWPWPWRCLLLLLVLSRRVDEAALELPPLLGAGGERERERERPRSISQEARCVCVCVCVCACVCVCVVGWLVGWLFFFFGGGLVGWLFVCVFVCLVGWLVVSRELWYGLMVCQGQGSPQQPTQCCLSRAHTETSKTSQPPLPQHKQTVRTRTAAATGAARGRCPSSGSSSSSYTTSAITAAAGAPADGRRAAALACAGGGLSTAPLPGCVGVTRPPVWAGKAEEEGRFPRRGTEEAVDAEVGELPSSEASESLDWLARLPLLLPPPGWGSGWSMPCFGGADRDPRAPFLLLSVVWMSGRWVID